MDLAKICTVKVIMEREKCLDALDLDLFSIFCLILSDLTAKTYKGGNVCGKIEKSETFGNTTPFERGHQP